MFKKMLCLLLCGLLLFPSAKVLAAETPDPISAETEEILPAGGASSESVSLALGAEPSFGVAMLKNDTNDLKFYGTRIVNKGTKSLRFYSSLALVSNTDSTYTKNMQLIDTDKYKSSGAVEVKKVVVVPAGATKELWFQVQGSPCKYNSDTKIYIGFICDGEDYRLICQHGASPESKFDPLGSTVTKVTLNKTSATLNAGSTLQLTPTATKNFDSHLSGAYWLNEYTWKSSNTSVAKVSASGKVTAVKAGTATITCSSILGQKKATCKITVKSSGVTKVTLNKTSASITKSDQKITLKATVSPSTATNKKVTWTSSNTKIAKVSSKGVVTPASPAAKGTVTITAKAGTKKATCKVTVNLDPVKEFVSRLYRVCLDRQPETKGLNWWVNRLRSRQETGGSCALGFFDSTEFKNHKYSNSSFLDHAYKAFFNRKADSAGKSYWLGIMSKVEKQVAAQYPRATVWQVKEAVRNAVIQQGFAVSDEWKNLCKLYKISP